MNWKNYADFKSNFSKSEESLDPLINKVTALKLLKELRSRKQGAELETLALYGGYWEGRKKSSWAPKPIMRAAFYECSVIGGEQKYEGIQERVSEH
jgi:hypothetical protein